MEYRTKITAASTVLAVLCLTAVFGTVFSQQAVNQRQSQQPLLAGFDPAAVTGLELSGSVSLKKTAAWTLSVGGKVYPAAAERIDGFVKSLALLKRERLAASAGDAKTFGLDQGFKTLKVLGAQGKPLADLEVGGVNDQGSKVYVRFAGAKEIWETDAGFSRSLGLDFNTWADLALFPPKKTPVRVDFEGRIQTADKSVYAAFDLVRTDGKDGKPVWQNRLTKTTVDADSWAENLPFFRFGAYAAPTDPGPDAAKLGTLTVGWSDGGETKVVIGKPDAQNRYRATDGTRDFWIADWSLTQLLYK